MKGPLRTIRIRVGIGAVKAITFSSGWFLPDECVRRINELCMRYGYIPCFVPDTDGTPDACLEVEHIGFVPGMNDETLPKQIKEIVEKSGDPADQS